VCTYLTTKQAGSHASHHLPSLLSLWPSQAQGPSTTQPRQNALHARQEDRHGLRQALYAQDGVWGDTRRPQQGRSRQAGQWVLLSVSFTWARRLTRPLQKISSRRRGLGLLGPSPPERTRWTIGGIGKLWRVSRRPAQDVNGAKWTLLTATGTVAAMNRWSEHRQTCYDDTQLPYSFVHYGLLSFLSHRCRRR